MILIGKNDAQIGPEAMKNLKHLPNSVGYTLSNAGHAAYMDQPEQWHKLLYNFINLL